MSEMFLLNPLEFELLVLPQSSGKVFLPTGAVLNKSRRRGVLEGFHNLIRQNLMCIDDESEQFILTEDSFDVVKNIVKAKKVLHVKRSANDAGVFFYLSSEMVMLEVCEHLHNVLRVGIVPEDEADDILGFRLGLSEQFLSIESEKDFSAAEFSSMDMQTDINGYFKYKNIISISDVLDIESEQVNKRLIIFSTEDGLKYICLPADNGYFLVDVVNDGVSGITRVLLEE